MPADEDKSDGRWRNGKSFESEKGIERNYEEAILYYKMSADRANAYDHRSTDTVSNVR
jgi:TPR repeat protein